MLDILLICQENAGIERLVSELATEASLTVVRGEHDVADLVVQARHQVVVIYDEHPTSDDYIDGKPCWCNALGFQAICNRLPTLLLLGCENTVAAVAAIKAGALDVIVVPCLPGRLLAAVRRARLIGATRQMVPDSVAEPLERLVAGSQPMIPVLRLVYAVRSHRVPVLLEGETGTGKEVIAREIHRQSFCANGNFVPVNCASLPESLFESEMFGVVNGAYTDARDRMGWLEYASGGTLFLDEIGDLPLTQQAKLLRVIESLTITRVGSVRDIRVSVRLICATNRDLGECVRSGSFRQDLFYRLSTYRITVPPLRERSFDIPALASAVAQDCGRDLGLSSAVVLAPCAIERLMEYHWPGNVREMRNVITRAIIAGDGSPITRDHISFG